MMLEGFVVNFNHKRVELWRRMCRLCKEVGGVPMLLYTAVSLMFFGSQASLGPNRKLFASTTPLFSKFLVCFVMHASRARVT
jgi:hypothetical protein